MAQRSAAHPGDRCHANLISRQLSKYSPLSEDPLGNTMQRDPVCGMMVDENRAKFRSEHDGKFFYFCSLGCKSAFDRDPQKYDRPK